MKRLENHLLIQYQVIQVNSDGRVDVVWIDKRRSSIIPSELYSINQVSIQPFDACTKT